MNLLVPSNLQKYEMAKGEKHLVKNLLEEDKGRLYGSTKVDAYVQKENIPLVEQDKALLVPYYETKLGFKVLIDGKYLGMIYHNEIFSKINIGDSYEGTIKRIRHDGLIDALLGKTGLDSIAGNEAVILEKLKASSGKLPLNDKSSPDQIKTELGMSKSAFKNAIGGLYKKRLISITPDGIELSS